MQQVQYNAQQWANLLGASGGALELSKCSFHVVHWHFAANGAPILYSEANKYGLVLVVDPNAKITH
jgi:hypothetical protein